MTLQERVDNYARYYGKNGLFAKWPASVPWVGREQAHDVIYGIWLIGNDYRNPSRFYGAYPKGYLHRVMALFPDVRDLVDKGEKPILHAFSGSIPADPHYDRCDMVQESEFQCRVEELPDKVSRKYDLVLADPPYSAEDAQRYDTPGVARGKVMRALAKLVPVGGHVVWLDTKWPMHSKEEWKTVGRIFIQRSTNHRVRLCSIFERW